MNYQLLLLILSVFSVSCGSRKYPADQNKTVYIQKAGGQFSLIRNGTPYIIKGACGSTHLRELAAAGGNTIRTYDTANLDAVIKEAEALNIAVVVGIYLPPSNHIDFFYNDSIRVVSHLESIKKTVLKYRNSPAVLMWCVGNELYFPKRDKYKNFYATFNEVVRFIHEQDPNHPVTTTMVNFDRANIFAIRHKTEVDIIAFNIFHGELKNLSTNIRNLSPLWNDPYLLLEWGIEGPWGERQKTAWMAPLEFNSTKKTEELLYTYQHVIPHDDPRLLGSFVFYWGHKQEKTDTWFSFFSEDGAPSPMVRTMQYAWTGKKPETLIPLMQHLTLNDKQAGQNVLLMPGDTASAKAGLSSTAGLSFKWKILPEDWHTQNKFENNEKKPVAIKGLAVEQERNHFMFKAPEKPGAYRLFVSVFDQDRNFLSSNIPFYVVEKN